MRNWKAIYKERSVSATDALSKIRSGSRIFISAGCGRPQVLVDALVNLTGKIADIEVIHMKSFGIAPYTSCEYEDCFRHNALFIGSNVSEAVAEGRADYTPIGKYQIAKLLQQGRIPIDVALIQVSPPNEQGYVSMGITVGISKTASDCAKFVVAQVNPNMPRTLGDSFLHISQIDAFVHAQSQIVQAPPLDVDEVTDKIAYHVARLIEDGAVLHLGYNSIAFALPKYLCERIDLGIHTDILVAPLVELIKCGAVSNARKKINKNKSITSLCYGSKEIYKFIDNNPHIEFHPCLYVNDPFIISNNDHMIALNEAHKVDLSGLVCAKLVGPRFGSGFMVGATHSNRGKSIAALPSTTPDEKESNIVMNIEMNHGVAMSTNRDDIQYVVTEFGIAALQGKTIRERALALIHIAHPKFREELMKAAKDNKYVHEDQLLPAGAIYPDKLEHRHILDNGLKIFIKPAKPTDERAVQCFVYKLDEKSIHYRFHGTQQTMHHSRVQHYVNTDYDETLTLLAYRKGEFDEEEIIGIAQYLFYPSNNQVEVAFITGEDFQNMGIGTYLLKCLIDFGREKNVEKFFAEVLPENRQMLAVFHKSGVELNSVLDDGVYHITLNITADK